MQSKHIYLDLFIYGGKSIDVKKTKIDSELQYLFISCFYK